MRVGYHRISTVYGNGTPGEKKARFSPSQALLGVPVRTDRQRRLV